MAHYSKHVAAKTCQARRGKATSLLEFGFTKRPKQGIGKVEVYYYKYHCKTLFLKKLMNLRVNQRAGMTQNRMNLKHQPGLIPLPVLLVYIAMRLRDHYMQMMYHQDCWMFQLMGQKSIDQEKKHTSS